MSCVLVAGMGRTGSTVMMRVLAASGVMPVADDPLSLEYSGIFDLAAVPYPYLYGRSLKVLNLRPTLPEGRYSVIVMDRDPKETVRSQDQLSRMVGLGSLSASDRRKLIRSHADSVADIVRYWEATGATVATCMFEDLLADPAGELDRLNMHGIGEVCPYATTSVFSDAVRSAHSEVTPDD